MARRRFNQHTRGKRQCRSRRHPISIHVQNITTGTLRFARHVAHGDVYEREVDGERERKRTPPKVEELVLAPREVAELDASWADFFWSCLCEDACKTKPDQRCHVPGHAGRVVVGGHAATCVALVPEPIPLCATLQASLEEQRELEHAQGDLAKKGAERRLAERAKKAATS